MSIRSWIAGALASGFLALPVSALAASPTTVPLPPLSARMQGMTEAGYTAGVFDMNGVTGEIPRLRSDGVNWLSIQVAWYQHDDSSTDIEPSATDTPSDDSVTRLIDLAHQNGMRVFLNPFINSEVGSGWQAVFQPSNVAAWFQSFNAFIAHYAKLAQADHVDLLGIGDEFDSLDTNPANTPYWDAAIKVARQYYSGPVTYGADYTNYQNVTFWGQLDEVGMDAYFPLSQSSAPTVAELAASWNQVADQIQAWRVSAGLTSKPFLITELGYPSENSAASNPGIWEPQQPVNTALQQELYEATFQSIWQRPWLAGIMWFWWANPSNPNWQGGASDNGYTLRDKPAETTLKQYFTASGGGGTGTDGGTRAPSSSGTAPSGGTPAPAPTFSDVAPSYWAYGDIETLAGKGIVAGFPDGTFQPDGDVTRAQFVTLLARTQGLQPSSSPTPFTDVAPSDWFAPYVSAAVQAGIVNGLTPTTFGPKETLTREQVAVLLSRALKLTGTTTLPFTDGAQIDPWAVLGVDAAVAARYMNGFPDGTFRPLGTTTRAQAARVLAALLANRTAAG